jgi:hypothetical protein
LLHFVTNCNISKIDLHHGKHPYVCAAYVLSLGTYGIAKEKIIFLGTTKYILAISAPPGGGGRNKDSSPFLKNGEEIRAIIPVKTRNWGIFVTF